MGENLKITAQIPKGRNNACKFTVGQTLCPEGLLYFPNKSQVQGAPLAEKIFGIEGVESVLISKNSVTVTRTSWENWPQAARSIASVLREQLLSKEAAVSADAPRVMISDLEMKEKVQEIFDTQINPAVAGHGGQVELLDVRDYKIYLKMGGGCHGCGMANMTLRQGIEGTIREKLPYIEEIVDVTDHSQGANPYYAPQS
jgi:Fe-S cluster biogenesis protein NfuA